MLAKFLANLFRGSDRARRGASHAAIDAYVAAHAVRKLHLGAGHHASPGWLGTDASPGAESIVALDATRPFPIGDASFDYVFTEHMIEHVSWHAGRAMLEECHRVLKPGGTLRVATPDLAVLLALYTSENDERAQRYVRWITERALPGIDTCHPVFVINNAFRSWGHQFLYDGDLLQRALHEAGFVNVRRCAYGESADPHLRGIEWHGRHIGDESIAEYETMVFEADREGAPQR